MGPRVLFTCTSKRVSWVGTILVLGLLSHPALSQAPLTLDETIAIALGNDPWLQSSEFKQAALEAESVAASALPDPRVGVALANVPTDSFDFNQEPMTQVKVDVAQQFPRGNTRSLAQQKLQSLSEQFPWQRRDREAELSASIARLWLELFKAQQTIALIDQNRALFEQLVDVAQARYASASGGTRQQDIIRAQLELTRLQDQLTVLQQQGDTNRQLLSEWLSTDDLQYGVAEPLPRLSLINNTVVSNNIVNDEALQALLLRHPKILAMDKRINAAATDVELAKQQYKPAWGLNASYAVRDEDLMGVERADFFSVGISFDVPLFTANKQDKQVSAATATAESLRTEKIQLLRNMQAAFKQRFANLQYLYQRQELYRQQLLPQMRQQADASLTAYTNDDGDFSEVMRARISELNANIDALSIDVNIQQQLAELNYFLAGGQP